MNALMLSGCLAVVIGLGVFWVRMPIPLFSKTMLTLALIFGISSIVLFWNNYAELGGLFVASASLFGAIENRVRHRRERHEAVGAANFQEKSPIDKMMVSPSGD